MTVARFFVDADLAAGMAVRLPTAVAHHATRVLRLSDDATIVLFNGRGGEFAARLRTDKGHANAVVEYFDPVERESPLRLTLLQALVAGDKLDWVVEKAVELGVTRIVISPAARSVVRLAGERLTRRLSHWREIVAGACAQCGRNRLPAVEAAASPAAAFAALRDCTQRFVLTPGAGGKLFAAAASIGLAVGPEGGFTEEELQQAETHGFVRTGLGPRVLRTETAGLAAAAALQAMWGDIAPRPA
jgi:16S rRNA (uracil1498-N3)-methyltransferase